MSMNRHIYIHIFKERKVIHNPTYETVRRFSKEPRQTVFFLYGKGNLVLRIFGTLQRIKDINRLPPPFSLDKN